jgi:hypothetical protein
MFIYFVDLLPQKISESCAKGGVSVDRTSEFLGAKLKFTKWDAI